jgi:frataxin-like iron-binding protein CyaY
MADYAINNKWSVFADMQFRKVNYQINGFRKNPTINHDLNWNFFNPKFKDFLKFLVNKQTPISFLHITTNGTIFDTEIVKLLNAVPNLEFRFSLESMGEEDEFIRWPTSWEDKNKNINQYLSQLNSKNYANICLQSLNLFSFDRTVNFIKSLPYNVVPMHNILSPSDIAALYHSDTEYIQEYLDTTENKESPMFIHALAAIKHDKSKVRTQALFFKDLAKVQDKELDKIFPIWYKYHSKYF